MSSILYFNHRLAQHADIQQYLRQQVDYDWTSFFKLNHWNPAVESFYFRSGANTFPFKNHKLAQLFARPDVTTDITFEQATDARAEEFKQLNQPLLVLWSGGIDSTVMVAAILKNFTPAERERVTIACNRISVYEYPDFYFKHIQPNFKLIDSSWIDYNNDLLTNYYILDGDPADQLYGGSTPVQRVFTHHAELTQQTATQEHVTQALKCSYADPDWAGWFYSVITENARSAGVKLNTVFDFFWWYSFNSMWITTQLRPLSAQTNLDIQAAKLYFNKFIGWFASENYQQWAQQNVSTIGRNIQELATGKLQSKRYIYEYTQDSYYYQYKFKQGSTGHYKKPAQADWVCLLDDYTRVSVDQIELIADLLPEHLEEIHAK